MSKKVRIGFIGAGWWATWNHMPILAKQPDVEMAGVCRLGPAMLQKVKDQFDFGFATEDYRELLKLGLDGVVVTSPHHLHYEHARAALEAGCHVMVEKPMTLKTSEAWELVKLAESKNRQLLVPYGWHYKPFVQQAKQLMNEGVVGQVEYVLCHMASPTKSLFAGAGEPPSEQAPTIAAPDPRTWQAPEQGGGYAHGQVTHSSALMFWLTGLRASEVACRMSKPNAEVDLYNSAAVTFANGALGTVSGAATLPDGSKFQVDLRIFGEEGVLLLDVERERVELRRHDGRNINLEIPHNAGAYDCDIPPVRFVELIQGQGSNDSPGEVAARSVEMIDAMFRSAAEGGRPVPVKL
ncbi:MAG TPA: Gfo/Idh/MocA family oxidoreductase [Caldilineaceae bacterium]|nr:Gfo/Idh/MocA family oxidoreductase [Caldilineaceae bacterium]